MSDYSPAKAGGIAANNSCTCPQRAQGRHGLTCEAVLRGAFGDVGNAPADVLGLLARRGALVQGTVIGDTAELPASDDCAHCGCPARGFAGLATGERVCHGDDGPDCYRRVTVYGEPLGSLLGAGPLPSGVEAIRDTGIPLP